MKSDKVISVIGLGKLGKPILEVFSKKYKTIGLDKGDSFSNLGDISFVVVPTPSCEDNKFTSKYIEDVLQKITYEIYKENVDIFHPVVIVSTVMPGETDRLKKYYSDINIIYSPTFIALGSVEHDFTHPDMVLIGKENQDKDVEMLVKILKSVFVTKPYFAIMTPIEAEIAKLTLNCYITSKITFANQIGNLCYRIGIKPDRILNAVGKDSRIGNKYFKAGLGYGGPCFPRDNLALSAYMKEKGANSMLFELIDSLNNSQIEEIINRVKEKNPNSVGFLGLSYKEGTEVLERSHLFAICKELVAAGYNVKLGEGEVTLDWDGIK